MYYISLGNFSYAPYILVLIVCLQCILKIEEGFIYGLNKVIQTAVKIS